MNRRKLEQHLRRHNCGLYGHGGGHDKWRRLDVQRGTVVPRHAEIKQGTVASICHDLDIPLPPWK